MANLGLLGALGGVGEGMAQIGMANLRRQAAREDAIDFEREMSAIRQERELALEETKYNRGRERSKAEASKVKGLVDADMADLEAKSGVSADQAGPSYKVSARDRIESDIRRRRELGLDTRDSLAELDRVDRSEQHQDTRTQNDRKFELDKQSAERAAKLDEEKIRVQQRSNDIAAGNASRQNRLADLQINEAKRREAEAEQERGLKRGLIDFQRLGDTESANIYKQELSLLGKNPDALSAKEKEILAEGFVEQAKALEKRANEVGPTTEEGKDLQARADRAWDRSSAVIGGGGKAGAAGGASAGDQKTRVVNGKTYVEVAPDKWAPQASAASNTSKEDSGKSSASNQRGETATAADVEANARAREEARRRIEKQREDERRKKEEEIDRMNSLARMR